MRIRPFPLLPNITLFLDFLSARLYCLRTLCGNDLKTADVLLPTMDYFKSRTPPLYLRALTGSSCSWCQRKPWMDHLPLLDSSQPVDSVGKSSMSGHLSRGIRGMFSFYAFHYMYFLLGWLSPKLSCAKYQNKVARAGARNEMGESFSISTIHVFLVRSFATPRAAGT